MTARGVGANAATAPRGRPRKLTSEAIVDAAISLIDTVGAESFTIRRLAEHLGVSEMTLYRTFPTKDLLLRSATLRVLEAVPPPPPASAPLERVLLVMHAHREVLRANPQLVSLVQEHIVAEFPASYPGATIVLESLAEAGVPLDRVIDVYYVIRAFQLGFAADEAPRAAIGAKRMLRRLTQVLRRTGRPGLAAVADATTRYAPDAIFDLGCRLLLNSVASEFGLDRIGHAATPNPTPPTVKRMR